MLVGLSLMATIAFAQPGAGPAAPDWKCDKGEQVYLRKSELPAGAADALTGMADVGERFNSSDASYEVLDENDRVIGSSGPSRQFLSACVKPGGSLLVFYRQGGRASGYGQLRLEPDNGGWRAVMPKGGR